MLLVKGVEGLQEWAGRVNAYSAFSEPVVPATQRCRSLRVWPQGHVVRRPAGPGVAARVSGGLRMGRFGLAV